MSEETNDAGSTDAGAPGAPEATEATEESGKRAGRRERQGRREAEAAARRDKQIAEAVKAPIDRAFAKSNTRPHQHPKPDPSRHFRAPPDYDPRTVEGDSPAAKEARACLTVVHNGWSAAAKAAADQASDPQALAAAVTKVVERATERAVSGGRRLDAQISHFREKVEELVKPRIDAGMANAIRAHWREKDGDLTALRAAILSPLDGGAQTMSAVLSGPAYLSGLSQENQQVLYTAAAENYAPKEYASLLEARDLSARVEKAAERFSTEMQKRLPGWARPQPAALNKLREMAAK